jgi:four helix bundle protein
MPSLKLEDLRVYQRAEELADMAWNIAAKWEPFAKYTIGTQLVRAADSIGANIAEGYGRGSFADNKRFVRIARGSLYEVRHFLRRADKRNLVSAEAKKQLRPLIKEIPPTINAYLKSIGRSNVSADEPEPNDKGPTTKDP